MYRPALVFATSLALYSVSLAQSAQPDGALVPFTSGLPVCASLCGPLFDVQGGCSDSTCFCADARLTPFNQDGTAGVSSVCGSASCSSTTDLQAVKTWYQNFCRSSSGGGAGTTGTPTTSTIVPNQGTARPTASSGTTTGSGNSQSSSGGGSSGSWIDTHKQYLIMAIVIVVGLTALWVGAWYWRRAYLRKKEREIEMSPPGAWGPHHVHGGNGMSDAESGVMSGGNGGHHKEMARDSTISGKRLTKGKMGWFKANK